MVACFFVYYEMINYDVTNSIFLFHDDIEEYRFFLGNLNFRTSYLVKGLADFGDSCVSV